MLLSAAWDDYVKAIASGELREVESRYSAMASTIVADIVPKELPPHEVADD